MSTTVIINSKTGLGEVENPFGKECPTDMWPRGDNAIWECSVVSEMKTKRKAWIDFNELHQPLLVITTAGEILTDGRYECEKVKQYIHPTTGKWITYDESAYFYEFEETREVWKVIETPELPGKETTLEQHEMHTLMEGKEIAEEDNFELALKKALEEEERFVTNGLKERAMAMFMKGYLFSRQEKHSIDRDKVIAEIEKRINLVTHYIGNTSIAFYDREMETLTDLLQVIKQMK